MWYTALHYKHMREEKREADAGVVIVLLILIAGALLIGTSAVFLIKTGMYLR